MLRDTNQSPTITLDLSKPSFMQDELKKYSSILKVTATKTVLLYRILTLFNEECGGVSNESSHLLLIEFKKALLLEDEDLENGIFICWNTAKTGYEKLFNSIFPNYRPGYIPPPNSNSTEARAVNELHALIQSIKNINERDLDRLTASETQHFMEYLAIKFADHPCPNLKKIFQAKNLTISTSIPTTSTTDSDINDISDDHAFTVTLSQHTFFTNRERENLTTTPSTTTTTSSSATTTNTDNLMPKRDVPILAIIDLTDLLLIVESKQYSQECLHKFSANNMGINDFTALQQLVMSGLCPRRLQLDFDNNFIDEKIIEILTQILTSGMCPQDLCLTLPTRYVSEIGANSIANALMSRKCPQGLQLTLTGVTMPTMMAIKKALISGRCSQNLSLNLGHKHSRTSAVPITEMLMVISGMWPQELQKKLQSEGNKLASFIAAVLIMGKCPKHLQLNLSQNEITDTGAMAIAEALMSGNCPEGLQLNLSGNEIGDGGATALVEVLKNANCPQGLKLDFLDNNISDVIVNTMVEMLRSNTSVLELKLSSISEEQHKFIQHCCMRNQLLAKYQHFPKLTDYIKQISYKAGYYIPQQSKIASLKVLTGLFFTENKESIEDYATVIQSLHDTTLQQFIAGLEETTQLRRHDSQTSTPTLPESLETTTTTTTTTSHSHGY